MDDIRTEICPTRRSPHDALEGVRATILEAAEEGGREP